MRPVARGIAPREYAAYQDAIADLENRLGEYCSYCERYLTSGLAVEHKLPKNLFPEFELEWSNFLLACSTCNSIKNEKVKTEDEILWPDLNNTVIALKYSEGGFVSISEELRDDRLNAKALSLIDLVGLDRHEADGWPNPSGRDKRWLKREECWKFAEISRSVYEEFGKPDEIRDLLINTAKIYGFFSVWLEVFREYAEVRIALIEAIPGTAMCRFNEGVPIGRPGAEI